MPCASFPVPPGPSSIENDEHGIEKVLLKNSSKLNKFLHSEVNLLIQHIIRKILVTNLKIKIDFKEIIFGCKQLDPENSHHKHHQSRIRPVCKSVSVPSISLRRVLPGLRYPGL